jgi:hypothetical protein
MAHVSNSFTSFKSAYYVLISHMYCLLLIFHLDCTRWCILCFSLILATKVNVVERSTTSAMWLYHQHHHSTHLTVGVIVASLSASLQHKTVAARKQWCQIALIWKLSPKFKEWCTFCSCVEAKLHKRNSHKMRHACTFNTVLFVMNDLFSRPVAFPFMQV